MGQKEDSERLRELEVLEALVENPEARQADLATRLGVAVGTVNWLLKRLVSKGYVKVKRIGRWQWRYLLTARGFAEKTRLTQQYLQYSMRLYRDTRQEASRLLKELKKRGYDKVCIEGDSENDLVDVCRLTCLEQGIAVVNLGEYGEPQTTHHEPRTTNHGNVPALHVDGQELFLKWPKEGENG
jgi:DNA-binding MarR family transcriptional regulator